MTGVDPQSLLNGDDPLLDFRGSPVNPQSKLLLDRELPLEAGEAFGTMLLCLWKAARKKKKLTALAVGVNFSHWFQELCQSLELTDVVVKEAVAIANGAGVEVALLTGCFTPEILAERASAPTPARYFWQPYAT